MVEGRDASAVSEIGGSARRGESTAPSTHHRHTGTRAVQARVRTSEGQEGRGAVEELHGWLVLVVGWLCIVGNGKKGQSSENRRDVGDLTTLYGCCVCGFGAAGKRRRLGDVCERKGTTTLRIEIGGNCKKAKQSLRKKKGRRQNKQKKQSSQNKNKNSTRHP